MPTVNILWTSGTVVSFKKDYNPGSYRPVTDRIASMPNYHLFNLHANDTRYYLCWMIAAKAIGFVTASPRFPYHYGIDLEDGRRCIVPRESYHSFYFHYLEHKLLEVPDREQAIIALGAPYPPIPESGHTFTVPAGVTEQR